MRLESELMREMIHPDLRGPMRMGSDSSDEENDSKRDWLRMEQRRMEELLEREMGDDNGDSQRPGHPREGVRKMMDMFRKPREDSERHRGMGRPFSRYQPNRGADPNDMNPMRFAPPPRFPGGEPSNREAMKRAMQIGDMVPMRAEKGLFINSDALDRSESVVSSVNPLEDPLQESSTEPVKQGDFLQFNELSSQTEDHEMRDSEAQETPQEIVDALKSQEAHFQEVFNHLLSLVDEQRGLQISHSQEGKVNLGIAISQPSPSFDLS